ncbi:sigma-70 family RNA polymerase sigma factor [uncultured Sanguibacteroides sp.]|uniref:RNA polymerase sigma factor n=1 Tax=uncultured Sanguibacteroides sp. TaxID=1635151 RepID=UPI0025CCC5C3|nr:sigma-70 family RNA polymerase sigma factor [uncultured Sanguibacteroides sp.]
MFNRYYKPLVLYAEQFTDDIPVAEDIVQEFFMRLLEDDYLSKISPVVLSSYLFTAIRNACYTHVHKRDVLRRHIEYTNLDIAAETASRIGDEIVTRVKEEIDKLPNQTRSVVDCILMQDMKYKETAEFLSISVNTVKTLLKNGMKTLREQIKNEQALLFLFFLKKYHF